LYSLRSDPIENTVCSSSSIVVSHVYCHGSVFIELLPCNGSGIVTTYPAIAQQSLPLSVMLSQYILRCNSNVLKVIHLLYFEP
jgi:hypothetical protein